MSAEREQVALISFTESIGVDRELSIIDIACLARPMFGTTTWTWNQPKVMEHAAEMIIDGHD